MTPKNVCVSFTIDHLHAIDRALRAFAKDNAGSFSVNFDPWYSIRQAIEEHDRRTAYRDRLAAAERFIAAWEAVEGAVVSFEEHGDKVDELRTAFAEWHKLVDSK